MNERILLKRLDELDRSFVSQYERYLEEVVFIAEKIIDNTRPTMTQIIQMPFPLQGELGRILSSRVQDALAAGMAHAAILAEELQRQAKTIKFSSPLTIDPEKFWLEPKEAIEALTAREGMLANDIEGELWSEVKKILLGHLQGTVRAETIAALAMLSKVSLTRANLIIITENTYAYNRGRLKGFREAGVEYVRFSAVMDARTSPQCRSRHGKVMRIDSPELADNTPPLHGRCRSVLSTVPVSNPELFNEEALDWSKAVPLPKGWRTR